MPPTPIISRRGRRSKATIVEIAPYAGVGGRTPATMSARRADRLFALYAPNVVFPNRAVSYEHQHQMGGGSRHPGFHLGDTDGLGIQASGSMSQGEDAPLIEVFHWKNRSRVGERKRLSENWRDTERVFTQFLHSGSADSACTCAHKDPVDVRLLSLESWVTKSIDYCNCRLSASALIEEGFFPSTPHKPRTAFSMRLLQVLHEQSVRGSISQSAWADGLRAVYEYDLKTSLPGFSRQVATLLCILSDTILT